MRCCKDSVGNTSVNVHSIACEINLEDPIHSSNQAKTVNWSSDCIMLLNAWRECDSSKKFEKSNERQIRMKEKIAKKPAKLNASLSKTNRSRINFAPEKKTT